MCACLIACEKPLENFLPMKNSTIPHSPISSDEIARRAREIWNSRGCPTGCDVEIWLEAERHLARASQTPPVNTKASRKNRTAPAKSTGGGNSNEVDVRDLNERLDDFGEPQRRSATSVDLT
jgi:hypothetical protein